MKKFYLLLLIVLSLINCDKKKGDTNVTTSKTNEPGHDKGLTLKESVARAEGTWISEPYLAAIEKNKAIYNNPAYPTTLFGFSIVKDSIADGEDYLYGFSTHDAGYMWPVQYDSAKKRISYNIKVEDSDNMPPSPFYLNPLTATTLEIVFTKSTKREVYRKADLEYELNRILFEGTYIDKATNKTVTFTKDGKVTGLEGKTMYQVQYDPEGEYAVPFDAVFLFTLPDDEAGTPYHYTISGNTLTLYNVNEKEIEKYVTYNYAKGTKAYTLTKT